MGWVPEGSWEVFFPQTEVKQLASHSFPPSIYMPCKEQDVVTFSWWFAIRKIFHFSLETILNRPSRQYFIYGFLGESSLCVLRTGHSSRGNRCLLVKAFLPFSPNAHLSFLSHYMINNLNIKALPQSKCCTFSWNPWPDPKHHSGVWVLSRNLSQELIHPPWYLNGNDTGFARAPKIFHVSVRDLAGLCRCPGPSLSTSVTRTCKQKSPEDLHKGSSFTGCLGGTGDAAEQSSWKSNYGCLPQQRSSQAEPQSLFSCRQKGEKRNSLSPKYLFTGWGGNVPWVLFFLSGCQRPILLKSLCWSGWSPPPLGTAQGAFLWEELGRGRSRKHHWFLKTDNFPQEQAGASWDHRLQGTQHLKLFCSFPSEMLLEICVHPFSFI